MTIAYINASMMLASTVERQYTALWGVGARGGCSDRPDRLDAVARRLKAFYAGFVARNHGFQVLTNLGAPGSGIRGRQPPSGLGVTVATVEAILKPDTEAWVLFHEAMRKDGGGQEGNSNAPERDAVTGKFAPTTNRDDVTVRGASTDDTPTDAPATIPISSAPEKPRRKRDYAKEARTGNSAGYGIRRLGKQRPDLLERVKAGAMTVNAAMVEAGFRIHTNHPIMGRAFVCAVSRCRQPSPRQSLLWGVPPAGRSSSGAGRQPPDSPIRHGFGSHLRIAIRRWERRASRRSSRSGWRHLLASSSSLRSRSRTAMRA